MPKVLTDTQLAFWRERGYHPGSRVIPAAEAAAALAAIDEWSARTGRSPKTLRGKAHLLLKTLSDLVRHPAVLDVIEDVIGPDILCLESGFFWKEARDPGWVSWHQDNTYLKLDPPVSVANWLALTDSHEDNGALRVIPGTHTLGTLPIKLVEDADNMLKIRREVDPAKAGKTVDFASAVSVELEPGEMSLHSNGIVHGSQPNMSDRRRVGFASVYVAPNVRSLADGPSLATLCRGEDKYGHFELEPEPREDFDPLAVAAYDKAMEGALGIYKSA
ncbi:MAG: phytanoyl-CoA dioxygenase [Rhodospirillaceae bacterium]|nr:phytanoyl-CoA dioxygenase [Rhodospirillaceae bacterium]MBT6118241.1 phytanoyl-CoA dioxygenase [Rhodospirillaceae bacterium]